MNLTIKRFKTCEGREGVATSFDLYVDGKLAGRVRNSGNGGGTLVDWLDTGARERVRAFAESRPARTIDFGDGDLYTLPPTVDALMDELADCYATDRRFKRLAKTSVLFQAEGSSDWQRLPLPAPLHGQPWSGAPSAFFSSWCSRQGMDPGSVKVFNQLGTVWGA